MDASITFVGKIRSELKRLEDCPRQEHEQAPSATIEVFEPFTEAMKDIRTGSELILFTWLHVADRNVLTTHPRNDPKAPLTGIFSTRSPDRPNPIGMHHVKVVSVQNQNMFVVAALEALDQTPVVDIKLDIR